MLESLFFDSPTGASLVVQSVKNPPARQETRLRFLGWDDPLEKKMATHSSILAWETPWTEDPGGLQTMGTVARQTLLSMELSRQESWSGLPFSSPGDHPNPGLLH